MARARRHVTRAGFGALLLMLAGGQTTACKNGAGKPDGPPSASASATVDPKPPGSGEVAPDEEMTAAQKQALGTLHVARPQPQKDWAPEVQQLLESIRPGQSVLTGLSEAQLIRALGKPDAPAPNQPARQLQWAIGAPPDGLQAAPVLVITLDDAGRVRDAAVQLSE